MDFLVLGPLQVRSDEGTTVPVDAAKQRAVLGVLVANVDRVVSVDRLLEDVWGDELPKGGTNWGSSRTRRCADSKSRSSSRSCPSTCHRRRPGPRTTFRRASRLSWIAARSRPRWRCWFVSTGW
jgi:hypothetical protein